MFTILHISDLHRSRDEPVDNDSLVAALMADRDQDMGETPIVPPPDAIVVSGDLIQGAPINHANWQDIMRDQYHVAEEFLDHLARRFLAGDRSKLIMIPGNHDVCWNTSFSSMRRVPDNEHPADLRAVWGPVAGYENKRRYGNAWRVTPVAGSGLDGQVAVAVRKGNDTLLASLDRALAELKPDIARLADKYGFPRTTPVILETSVAPSPTLKAAAGENQASIPAGNGDAVSAARETFNNHCSHCHAPNAMSPVRERDLRRLKLRYGDKWREVAATAIKNGRPENGMPPWKDLLDDKRIGLLLSFFETIQREP